MTNSRSFIARFALPLAATALVLTACGSTTADGSAEPAAESAMVEASAMASDEMASDEMASDEAMSEETEGHSDDMASDEGSSDEMTASDDAMMSDAGAYISLADYESGKDMYDAAGDVVLFFNASWCPTCQETQKNLEGDPAAIPAGLTIVKVDYDDSDELKQKYGITTQHSFVQIDAAGNELAKWTGSSTADEIAGQTV